MTASCVALEILGTGEYVPRRRIESAHFDRQWNKPSGWTFEQTGVESRAHASPGESGVTMATAAARDALEAAALEPARLDAVVSVSSVGHQAIPCTAVLVHRALGLERSGIPAFDVNSTCTGFLTALDLIAQAIATGRMRHVLIVAGEVASRGLNWQDPNTAGLFGDGGGAVVIGTARTPRASLRGFLMRTFSVGADLCQVRACGTGLSLRAEPEEYLAGTYFEMKGRSTYRLAATLLPDFMRDLMAAAGIRSQDVDVWVPHQASGKALSHLQEALGLPPDKLVRILATHGNQVAASIPIALHRGITSGRIRPGSCVGILGTGAGISLGGAVMQF